MSGQATDEQMTVENITVVDADAHSKETDEQLAPYIEEAYPAIGRQVAEMTGHENRIRSGTRAGVRYTSSYNSDSSHEYLPTQDGYSLPDKLAEMNDFSIDKALMTPTMLLNINTTNNPEFGFAYAKGYNTWLEDNFLDRHEGVKAAVVTSRHKPDKSAEEIDRLADEPDIAAVWLGLGGLTPPLGSREYDPIYEAAERNGLPMVFHGTGSAYQWNFPVQYQHTHTGSEDALLANPLTAVWQLGSSIYKGLPERFPDLEFVFQESGIGWVPYFVWRMDDYYLDSGRDLPMLDQVPSEYIRDNYYFTTQPLGHTNSNWASNEHYANIVDMIGPESVLYSADLPHATFDAPDELFNRIQPHFDDDTVRNIMGETAADLFGF